MSPNSQRPGSLLLVVVIGIAHLTLYILTATLAPAQTPTPNFDQIEVKTQLNGGPDAHGNTPIKITFINHTTKVITAWSWVTEAKLPDGSVKAEYGAIDSITDLLGPDKSRLFQPGTSRSSEEGISGQLADFSTHLTAVMFDDGTGIGEAKGIADGRKAQAAEVTKELEELDQALKSSTPKEKVRAVVERRRGEKPYALGISQQLLGALEHDASPANIAAFQSVFYSYRDLLLKHSEVKQ